MKQFIIILMSLLPVSVVLSQEDAALNVQEILETKNFIFKAETVSPARGRTRQLTTEYDVVVKPDTVICYLPYFGRAYTAPIDPSDGGIKFTSAEFNYILEKRKKQRWDLTITPKDARDVQALYFTIFENGRASLRVNSTNRQGISFNGYVVKGKAEKRGF
ncbi:MAG TPA: DUF4251 domain-containing protein [Chitinophagaceae bacterium]|nr:DUF4251 domain-containing protein [Chitinophagaceae bacterium]HUM65078.1 DUF4251 domain-containing protein [Chitinophagaceae bacterium]